MRWKMLATMGVPLILPACAANLLNAARLRCWPLTGRPHHFIRPK